MQTIPLPKAPKIAKKDGDRTTIEIEGCAPGYGMTIGNALRRTILSSLPGAAITGVKINGVLHEFSTIPGVLENVVTIILNLKQIRVKLHGEETVRGKITAKGRGVVTAGAIETGGEAEIVNPEQPIATITDDASVLEMELEIEAGMGYVPVEERRKEKLEIGFIALDAIFSPIRRVNFEVENMRVGDRTDYNRIRFDIETDGTTTAEAAFEKSVDILMQQFAELREFEIAAPAKLASREEAAPSEEARTERAAASELAQALGPAQSIDELKLGTRVLNILKAAGYETIGSIAARTDGELLAVEGLGEKALKDIKKALGKLGLTLPEQH